MNKNNSVGCLFDTPEAKNFIYRHEWRSKEELLKQYPEVNNGNNKKQKNTT